MNNFFYKKELNPRYWDANKQFNPKIRRKILKIIKDFLDGIDIDIPIYDIRLTGSLANYTYNKFSDLDIHIITKFKDINKDVKLVKESLNDKRFIWNLKHNIYIKGHEVELYFENKGEPHAATGIYSLLRDKWVRQPDYNPPTKIDTSELKQRVLRVTDQVRRLERKLRKTKDKQDVSLIYNKARRIKDKIMRVRKEALQESGDFAFENLLFKQLRNNGTIEKILDLINGSYDRFFMEKLMFNKALSILTRDL